MPRSRKRTHSSHRTPPARSLKRKRGRIIWAVLFGIFGLVIGMVSTSESFVIPIVAAFIGAGLGYLAGRAIDADTGD